MVEVDNLPDWLPGLIEFEGDWNAFIDDVYANFCDDLVHNKVSFQGSRVSVRKVPESNGKGFGFWHCVSEGQHEHARIPDLERCKRVCWIRAIIENHADSSIDHWTNKRGTETNHLLWFKEQYLVVLAEREGYCLLKTAYPTDREHTKTKLRRERDSATK